MTAVAQHAIAIAVPVHNGGRFLDQALGSLRAQTRGDIGIFVLDDASTDGSFAIVERHAAADSRIACQRAGERLGMIEAWRRAARLAFETFQPEYFAWHSDHDWSSPGWLETLHATLQANPDVVLAHARTELVDLEGTRTGTAPPAIDTTGLSTPDRLARAVFSEMGAGNAVYGLFRRSALEACGIMRDEILPDRLLVAEVNLHGSVAYVERAERFRRGTFTSLDQNAIVSRQMRNLFRDGYERRRPYTSHTTCFLRHLAQPAPECGNVGRDARMLLAMLYYERSLSKFKQALVAEFETLGPEAPDPAVDFVRRGLRRAYADRDARPAPPSTHRDVDVERLTRTVEQLRRELKDEQDERSLALSRAERRYSDLDEGYRLIRCLGAVGRAALAVRDRWRSARTR